MKGCWQQSEETSSAFDAGGWFYTGNIALITDQDRLELVDRKKDIIIVSGFNVYPSKIEQYSMNIHLSAKVAVDVASEASGEAVEAFVMRKEPSLTETQNMGYCREQPTGYKIPKIIEFRKALPKNPLGKVLRHALTTTRILSHNS